MPVEINEKTITIRPRKDPLTWLWSALYMVLGVVIATLPFFEYWASDRSTVAGSAVLGLIFFLTGAAWLATPRDSQVFDLAERKVRERRWSWWRLGLRTRIVHFDSIASLGRETWRDPRTRQRWSEQDKLRLKSGDYISVERVEEWDRVGHLTGIAVQHDLVEREEPAQAAG